MSDNYIDDSKIIDEVDTKHAPQIPISAQETILNSIARIKTNLEKKKPSYGTGFFMKTRIKNVEYHFLVTCYHVVGQEQVNSKKKIAIYYGNKNEEKEKIIKLDKERFIKYYDKPIDIILIEILESDNIKDVNYLIPDMNYKIGFDFYLKKKNAGLGLYLAGYPKVRHSNGEKHISSGYITKVDSFKFNHNLDTRAGSSGSPICLIDNENVIGIHKGGDENKVINYGTFIGIIINDLDNINIKEYKNNEDCDYINEFKKNKNNIILLGDKGVGKTYFLNKICNTNFQISEYYELGTEKVQYSYTENGNMLLIDIPGKYIHSYNALKAMKNILVNIPMKAICIIDDAGIACRIDGLLHNIRPFMKSFEKYKKNIIVIITSNREDGIHEKLKESYKLYLNKEYQIKNVLFIEFLKVTDFNEIYKLLENMQKKMETITQMEFPTGLLLPVIRSYGIEGKIREKRNELQEKFSESLELFQNEISKASDSDLKRALYFALKNYKESLIKKYTEILKNEEEYSNEIIDELIDFSREIFSEFNHFTKRIEREIEIKISYNNKKECNEFRRCPYCGLIWLQTQGCNDVFCGERTDSKDKIYGIYKNYIVKYENKNITIETEEINNIIRGNGARIIGMKEEEIEKNIQLKQNGKPEIKLLGCGKLLKWDEMEDVTYYVKEFLKEIPLSDYYSDIMEIADSLD